MKNTLTKKQAEALRLACWQWKDQVSLITDEDSVDHVDWLHNLKSISYQYTIPVDLEELYFVVNEVCCVLSEKLDKGEFE